MLSYEIEKRLDELKECEIITICTDDGFIYNVDFRTIINDDKNQRLIIDFDQKSYAYCHILDIRDNF